MPTGFVDVSVTSISDTSTDINADIHVSGFHLGISEVYMGKSPVRLALIGEGVFPEDQYKIRATKGITTKTEPVFISSTKIKRVGIRLAQATPIIIPTPTQEAKTIQLRLFNPFKLLSSVIGTRVKDKLQTVNLFGWKITHVNTFYESPSILRMDINILQVGSITLAAVIAIIIGVLISGSLIVLGFKVVSKNIIIAQKEKTNSETVQDIINNPDLTPKEKEDLLGEFNIFTEQQGDNSNGNDFRSDVKNVALLGIAAVVIMSLVKR